MISNVVFHFRDEIRIIKKTSLLRAINMSLFYTSSKVIIFLTLLTYVLLDNKLDAEKVCKTEIILVINMNSCVCKRVEFNDFNDLQVFVTLSLYNSVRLVMTLFFPNAIAQLAEALVSVRRLQVIPGTLQRFIQCHDRSVKSF